MERALARENERVQALQAVQLAERQRVTDERLGGALVRGLLDELDEEAAHVLEAFKKEQQERLEAKKAEMEQEEEALAKELDDELKKLEELKQKAKAIDDTSSSAKKSLVRKASTMAAAKLSGAHGL